MKKYSLEIVQTADGEESIVAADALGEAEDGRAYLKYAFDGAEYSLYIGADFIRQERAGEVNIVTEFKCGKRTLGKISDGSGEGAFPIFTSELDVVFDGENVKAVCVFADGEGGGEIRLCISAAVVG